MTGRPQPNAPTGIPADLVGQVVRGNCVLLLGPKAGKEHGIAAMVRTVVAEWDYWADRASCSLLPVACYYIPDSGPVSTHL